MPPGVGRPGVIPGAPGSGPAPGGQKPPQPGPGGGDRFIKI